MADTTNPSVKYLCSQCTWTGPESSAAGDGNNPVCPDCSSAATAQPGDAVSIGRIARNLLLSSEDLDRLSALISNAAYNAMRGYGMSNLVCAEDGLNTPYPLVDLLSTKGQSIATGEREMELIADAIFDEVRATLSRTRFVHATSTKSDNTPRLSVQPVDVVAMREDLAPNETASDVCDGARLVIPVAQVTDDVEGGGIVWFGARPSPGTHLYAISQLVEGVEGMPVTQEPKYGIRNNRLYNRASGEFIPSDEPVFLFRARDAEALPTLRGYRDRFERSSHQVAVAGRVEAFASFAANFPRRMKHPDTAALQGGETHS
jgi:hypothetical protein